MRYDFFAMLARMRCIRRWSLMNSTFPENDQEHSYMVAVLAHGLAVIQRDVFGRPADPDRCAVLALFHDSSEVLTGDLPATVKYRNPRIREAYRELEASSRQELLEMLPPELRPQYAPYLLPYESDAQNHAIVRAADKLSAYLKCVEEVRVGNIDFENAAERNLQALRALEMPCVNYFLSHFLISFQIKLDKPE